MNLTDPETKRLEELEKIVFKGIKTFSAVWEALLEIHDRALFREGYTSFTAYCQQRFGIQKAHAYRLLAAARHSERCLQLETSPPQTENQAREEVVAVKEALKKLPPKEQREAILAAEREAIEEARKPKVHGGAQQKDRLDSGLRAIRKASRIFDGFGPEGEPIVAKLEEARQAAESIIILRDAA